MLASAQVGQHNEKRQSYGNSVGKIYRSILITSLSLDCIYNTLSVLTAMHLSLQHTILGVNSWPMQGGTMAQGLLAYSTIHKAIVRQFAYPVLLQQILIWISLGQYASVCRYSNTGTIQISHVEAEIYDLVVQPLLQHIDRALAI